MPVSKSVSPSAVRAVDETELLKALSDLGQLRSEVEVKQYLADAGSGEVNEAGSLIITFEEFCELYGKAVVDGKEAERSQLYDAFRVLDRDGSGYLEREELMSISVSRAALACGRCSRAAAPTPIVPPHVSALMFLSRGWSSPCHALNLTVCCQLSLRQ